jgi:hypothetical protein
MTTDASNLPDPHMPSADVHTHQETPSRFAQPPSGFSPELVARTKNQIQVLVQEIAKLAQSNCELDEFLAGFLMRVTGALGGVAAAAWLKNADGQLELKYQINLAKTCLPNQPAAQQRHARLLDQLLAAGDPALIPPQSGGGSDEAGNPTEHLLLIGPLKLDQETPGLIEIFQRPGAGPATQRGYQRFVVQMCDLASGHLKNRRLRQFVSQQELWGRLQQFIRSIHQDLDVRQTVFAIANDGRRLIDCDRLSVAVGDGHRCSIESVSGLDALEKRAEQIKLLNRLVRAVLRGRTPLWYAASTSDLPPQVEEPLHAYVNKSHTKMLAVIPLHPPVEQASTGSPRSSPSILGALVVEQLTQSDVPAPLRQRVEVVAVHAGDALANSIEHSRIFLLPLWRRLGAMTRWLSRRALPKTLLVAGALCGMLSALWLVPYPFDLTASGKLQPTQRYEIFASVDGTLDEILVPDDPTAMVEQGQILARMTNNDLLVKVRDLEGQRSQLQERIRNLDRAFSEPLDRLEQLQVERDLAEAIEQERSVANQLLVKQQELKLLQIMAPARGYVGNWQIRQNLLRRPVVKGHNLMTLIDPESPWELELEMPERRMSHLLQAARGEEPLRVTFALASHPGHEYQGTLLQIDRRLEVRGEEGNTALVRVAIDKSTLPAELLRSGTRVAAHVHCGKRSIGYVWFREVIESLHTAWLKWF